MSHPPRRSSILELEYGCCRAVLHKACALGDMPLVRELALQGAKTTDGQGRTAMHRAAAAGQLEAVLWLAATGEYSMSARTMQGRTPLHAAVLGGHLPVVRALLELPGVDARALASDGSDAVLLAAKAGRFDVLHWLVGDAGLRADTRDDGGACALHWAVIRDGGTGGGVACARYLLACGQGAAAWQDSEGNNVAHYAALCGRLGLLQWLVDTQHIDLRAQNYDGLDCAAWARLRGQMAVSDWISVYFAAQDCAQTQKLLSPATKEDEPSTHTSFADLGGLGRTFAALGSSVARFVNSSSPPPQQQRRMSQMV